MGDRRLLQKCITTIANYNWKYFGSGFYSGSDFNDYQTAAESIRSNLTPVKDDDMEHWWNDYNVPSTLTLFEDCWKSKVDSFWEYLDGFEQRHYSDEELFDFEGLFWIS